MLPAKLPAGSLPHLDLMRGLAAFAVVAFHVRGLMFVDYDQLSSPGRFIKLAYLSTGFGHQAVVIFFVLSGVFIGNSVLSSNSAGTWSWRRFLLNRFTRLYVVLVPALLLTFAWDSVGMHLFGANGNIYAGLANAPHGNFEDVRQTIGATTFLGNLAFLQQIFCRCYGSNSPLWSLSLEFWVYILFPLLVRALAPRSANGWQLARRATMLAAAAALVAVAGRSFAFYATIWMLGALVARSWSIVRLHALPGARVWGGLLFAGALMVARLDLAHDARVDDAVLGVGTAAFVLSLLSTRASRPSDDISAAERTGPQGVPSRRSLYVRGTTLLAGCSYTLYLTHFPPLALAHAAWFQTARWGPDPLHMGVGLLVALGLVVAYAYPLSRFGEARTDVLRRWVERRLPRELSSRPKPERA